MVNFIYICQVTAENKSLIVDKTFRSWADEPVFVYDAVGDDLPEEMQVMYPNATHLINDKNREGIVYSLNRGLRYVHAQGAGARIVTPGVFNEEDINPDSSLDVDFSFNSWDIRKVAMDKIGYFDGVLRDKLFLLDYYSRAKSAELTADIYSGILSKDCEGEDSNERLSFSSVIFGTKWSIQQGLLPEQFKDWIDSHKYTFTDRMVVR